MNAGTWILSILLFIVSLGILIAIHELGHFMTAKMFNVYVQEYAIGMGPRLFSRKRKYGETYFSLRAVPFGGFCSMYGEEIELQDGLKLPKERSLEGISKWKKAIIFAAGVTMNFVLAYVLFFINDAFFIQTQTYAYVLDVKAESKASLAGVLMHDGLDYGQYEYTLNEKGEKVRTYFDESHEDYYLVDDNATYTASDGTVTTNDVYVIISSSDLSITKTNFSLDQFKLCSIDKTDPKSWVYDFTKYPAAKGASYTFTPKIFKGVSDTSFSPDHIFEWEEGATKPMYRTGISTITVNAISQDESAWHFEDIGISMFSYHFKYGFGEAFGAAGRDWCNANTLLVKAIGNLFIGQGWSNVGGPISIITQTTSVLSTMGFGYYIWYWGAISCNLAIFNLLPFPGLDGWHLVVVGFEGITRKKVPNKVKNAISAVGMILLFGLMIAVVIKDIVMLF